MHYPSRNRPGRRQPAPLRARLSGAHRRSELGPLALDPLQEAHVLVIVSKNERSITLNLKAPLIINLQRRIGRQVVTNVDQPLQYELSNPESSRKKIA